MAVRVTIQDGRLVGARHLAVVSHARIAVSSGNTRRVVMVDPALATVAGASAALPAAPGPLALCGGALWAACEDGSVRKLSTADAPVVSTVIVLAALSPTWISACGAVVIAPAGAAGIATIDSATGRVLDQHDDVLARVVFAIASAGGYVYAFDGVGGGAVLTVSSAGTLRVVTRFAAMNAVGPVHGFISGTDLVLACARRSAVIVLDLTDATEPVIASTARYPGFTVRSVLDNVARSPLTDEPYAPLGMAEWWPIAAGILLDSGRAFLVHAASGRATMFPLAVVDAGPDQIVDLTTTSVNLAGAITAHQPGAGALSHLWVQVSGPAATITSAANLATAVTLSGGLGDYVFRLTASVVGDDDTNDTVTISVQTFRILNEAGEVITNEADERIRDETGEVP